MIIIIITLSSLSFTHCYSALPSRLKEAGVTPGGRLEQFSLTAWSLTPWFSESPARPIAKSFRYEGLTGPDISSIGK